MLTWKKLFVENLAFYPRKTIRQITGLSAMPGIFLQSGKFTTYRPFKHKDLSRSKDKKRPCIPSFYDLYLSFKNQPKTAPGTVFIIMLL